MLIKNILVGLIVSFVCTSFLAGTSIAGENDKSYASLRDKESFNTMGNDGIEFGYSPMTVSSSLASASSRHIDSEIIEFDYSPRKDSKLIATRPAINTDSKDIQFDYSPRPMKCGTSYC